MRMLGKTVVVTGGTRGIGRAIALRFAELGANIVVNYANNKDENLFAELSGKGGMCRGVRADIGDYEQAGKVIQKTIDTFGSIDVLVNNAGITRDNLLMRMSEKDFDDVVAVNLKGAFNTIQHVSGIMVKQRGGTIINMASVVGLKGNAGQANYAASKAGIIGLTKSAARELAGRGITVNAIAPGFIETDMTNVLSDSVKAKMLENIPLKRFGDVDDVARVAVFLAENPYITGQIISVDGGMNI